MRHFKTMEFNKDGSGKLNLIQYGETATNLFKYENTENKLVLTFLAGPLFNEGDKLNYTLDWKKNEIHLYTYETWSSSNGNGWYEETTVLKKK